MHHWLLEEAGPPWCKPSWKVGGSPCQEDLNSMLQSNLRCTVFSQKNLCESTIYRTRDWQSLNAVCCCQENAEIVLFLEVAGLCLAHLSMRTIHWQKVASLPPQSPQHWQLYPVGQFFTVQWIPSLNRPQQWFVREIKRRCSIWILFCFSALGPRTKIAFHCKKSCCEH